MISPISRADGVQELLGGTPRNPFRAGGARLTFTECHACGSCLERVGGELMGSRLTGGGRDGEAGRLTRNVSDSEGWSTLLKEIFRAERGERDFDQAESTEPGVTLV